MKDIEYAALALGKMIDAGMRRFWKPLEDDGDSRRLEAACMRWLHSNETKVPVHVWERDCELDDARRAGNAQEYRNAVFELAVAIGKVISSEGEQ
jgi:hypothetical protein